MHKKIYPHSPAYFYLPYEWMTSKITKIWDSDVKSGRWDDKNQRRVYLDVKFSLPDRKSLLPCYERKPQRYPVRHLKDEAIFGRAIIQIVEVRGLIYGNWESLTFERRGLYRIYNFPKHIPLEEKKSSCFFFFFFFFW